jgi:toxin ParE1/3/4
LSHAVLFTRGALHDLQELHAWLERRAGPGRADAVLDRLDRRCLGLAELPTRGNAVPELQSLGIRRYLELHERPWRIVYHVEGHRVLIDAVLDGRRDMQDVLARRLLR